MSTRLEFEVVVVGGGPVGACMAALLAREAGLPAARVALLAPDAVENVSASTTAPANVPALRVSAISRASAQILAQADAWSRVPAERLCPYERMRVWHESMPADSSNTLVFDAAELAEPDLGVIVENHVVTRACLQSFVDAGGTVLPMTMDSLQMHTGGVGLNCRGNDGAREISARLVIGADGSRSAVREHAGIRARVHDYQQLAIVANVATAKPHQHTAWQRFLSSGPVALLPLCNGECSIVWSADKALAEALMKLPDLEFAQRLGVATDHVFGSIQMRSERAAFPLARVSATQLIAPRVAIVGDAAHQIHPLAGQGVNLGFLDADALCNAVRDARSSGEDIGAPRALRPYEQARYTHNQLMSGAMSAFNAAFGQSGLLGEAAAWALGAAGGSASLRRLFTRHAMGMAGGVQANPGDRMGS